MNAARWWVTTCPLADGGRRLHGPHPNHDSAVLVARLILAGQRDPLLLPAGAPQLARDVTAVWVDVDATPTRVNGRRGPR